MARKRSVGVDEAFKRIMESVEDHIRENYLFPSISEIRKRTSLPDRQTREILETLVGQKQLTVVFQAKSHPTLYAPTYMMQEIMRAQAKPNWVNGYASSERDDIKEQLGEAREKLNKHDLLEGLLYRTDIPLQDSIEHALKLVEFDEVQHYRDDKDNPDLSFKLDNKKFIVEVKGKAREADKDDVLELEGWIRVELDKGADSDELVGMLIVNHFRNVDPKERGEFFTQHAKNFAKRYKFRAITTLRVFELVQKVLKGELTKERARSLIVEGESYG